MATGNVSNRQRMINMMYLVLLALLALNVSADVLDAFAELRDRLALSAENAEEMSADFAASMAAAIDNEVSQLDKTNNLGLKDTLALVRSRTTHMIRLISKEANHLHEMARWDEEEQRYLRADETELNFQYLMGSNEMAANGRGNGAALRLRDSLDAYARFIADLYNGQVLQEEEKIEPDLTQNPPKHADEPAKSWERHTFEGPVAANLATLESLKMDLYRQEQKLLELLNGRLGANTYVADSLIAINMPVTEVVTAGLPFQTRMTVALTSRFFQPSFSSGSGRVELTDGGNAALLNILADGSRIPEGKEEAIQRYSAMIELPTRTGVEQVPVQGSFKVRRPEVVVTSEAVQVLYRNCANTLRIDVPSLGEVYDPVVTATGGDVRESATAKRRFLVTPNARRCKINVATRSQGKVVPLRDMAYKVIEPPAPGIEMMVNGRAYNGLAAIPRSSRLQLSIKPDRSFFESFPKDARYRVRAAKIMLKDGLQPPRVVGTVSLSNEDLSRGANLRLPSEVRQARPGAMLYVQLDEIERINYRGQAEKDERFPESLRTFAFSLR